MLIIVLSNHHLASKVYCHSLQPSKTGNSETSPLGIPAPLPRARILDSLSTFRIPSWELGVFSQAYHVVPGNERGSGGQIQLTFLPTLSQLFLTLCSPGVLQPINWFQEVLKCNLACVLLLSWCLQGETGLSIPILISC